MKLAGFSCFIRCEIRRVLPSVLGSLGCSTFKIKDLSKSSEEEERVITSTNASQVSHHISAALPLSSGRTSDSLGSGRLAARGTPFPLS